MAPLVRPQAYIGRQIQKEALRFWSQSIAATARCRALSIEAAGGLGKTRLLEDYPAIVREVCPTIRVARIIDLYDFANRSPDEIEQRLIAGLRQTDSYEWHRLPAERVAAAFAEYSQVQRAYLQARVAADESRLQQLRDDLRADFVACWNRLAAQHPLVICFDTIETLFSHPAPPEALVSAAQGLTGAGQVLDWMSRVLPQLHHTLVLLSGRPIAPHPNSIIDRMRQLDLLVDVLTLTPFDTPDEAEAYLQAYTLNVPPAQIDQVLRITEGRPLLLTCYAEMHRPEWAIPPSLPVSEAIASRTDLENQIIDTILNPIDRPSLAERTLVYCLFFLAYARRGIRRHDLRELFEQLGFTEYDNTVIDCLDQLALVKKALGWRGQPVGETPSDDTLLFLHDEIYQLIDESALPQALGLRDPTLDYLCALSRSQVQQAQNRAELFKAMSDHMYYELRRDIAGSGYRAYTIYTDWLLRERDVEAAVILSDVFWSVLNTVVQRDEGAVRPYRAALDESPLAYAALLRDEQVRLVKLLRARDQNIAAAELAERLYQQYVRPGAPNGEGLAGALSISRHLVVDLTLAQATAIIQAHPSGHEGAVEALFSQVIAMLESALSFAEPLLDLRRWYFLGLAYNLRGQLRRRQQRFAESIQDAEQGRIAFKRYREEPHTPGGLAPAALLNDRIDPDVAQSINNLAYNLALSGNLKRALRLSNEVIERYSAATSDYRRALFYNTNGLIRIRLGEYLEAQTVIQRAEKAAQDSGSQRARGLVADARGQLEREMMLARQEPEPAIERYYEEAARLLQNERGTLQEIYYNWAGLMRNLAALYHARNELSMARSYNQRALELFEQSLALLPEGASMQRANLLQSQAAVYNYLQDNRRAAALLDAAEALMDQPMPEYGQVIAGRIAMQRALVLRDGQRDYPESLRMIAIALARAYLFARQHRDQKIFEQLIEREIRLFPDEALIDFKQAVDRDRVRMTADALSFQRPDPARWENEWGYSIRFIHECIATQLDL